MYCFNTSDSPQTMHKTRFNKIFAALIATCALFAAGCATSGSHQGASETLEYNPATGYPLVGSRLWSR